MRENILDQTDTEQQIVDNDVDATLDFNSPGLPRQLERLAQSCIPESAQLTASLRQKGELTKKLNEQFDKLFQKSFWKILAGVACWGVIFVTFLEFWKNLGDPLGIIFFILWLAVYIAIPCCIFKSRTEANRRIVIEFYQQHSYDDYLKKFSGLSYRIKQRKTDRANMPFNKIKEFEEFLVTLSWKDPQSGILKDFKVLIIDYVLKKEHYQLFSNQEQLQR